MASRLFRSGNQLGLVLGKSREDPDDGQYLMTDEIQRQLSYYCYETAIQAVFPVILYDYTSFESIRKSVQAFYKFNTKQPRAVQEIDPKLRNEVTAFRSIAEQVVRVNDKEMRAKALIIQVGMRLLLFHPPTGTLLQQQYVYRVIQQHDDKTTFDTSIVSDLIKLSGIYIDPTEKFPDVWFHNVSSILSEFTKETMEEICIPKIPLSWTAKTVFFQPGLKASDYLMLFRDRYTANQLNPPAGHSSPIIILDAHNFNVLISKQRTETASPQYVVEKSFSSNGRIGNLADAALIIVPVYNRQYRPVCLVIRKIGGNHKATIKHADDEAMVQPSVWRETWQSLKLISEYTGASGAFNVFINDNIKKYTSMSEVDIAVTGNKTLYRRRFMQILDDVAKSELRKFISSQPVKIKSKPLTESNFTFKHYMTD
jgi:hypothetical protein